MGMRWTMTDEPDDGGVGDMETGVATRTRPRTKKPSNYKVLMLNDDYTCSGSSPWESRTRRA